MYSSGPYTAGARVVSVASAGMLTEQLELKAGLATRSLFSST